MSDGLYDKHHGYNAYTRGCRCETCKEAKRSYMRAHRTNTGYNAGFNAARLEAVRLFRVSHLTEWDEIRAKYADGTEVGRRAANRDAWNEFKKRYPTGWQQILEENTTRLRRDAAVTTDLAPITEPEQRGTRTITERFNEFHQNNPHVLEALERLTQQELAAGHTRLAIDDLFNTLRWDFRTPTQARGWRLNDHYRSRYALLMKERHPEWADVFETRPLRAA